MKPVLCFSFLLIMLAGAVQTRAQVPVEAPSAMLAATSTTSVADASPAEPALPEAPLPERVIAIPELAVIKPAVVLPEAPKHRFFDQTNLRLHLGVIAGETSDLITTRSILQAGGQEANPISRPLMQAGLGGQLLATYGLGEGGALLGAYVLHRTGHHRLERFVPIAAIVLEGLATASNIRTRSNMRAHH